MLKRLTVSALLKAVILTTAFCVMIGLSLSAWDSWERLRLTSRISAIADASATVSLAKPVSSTRMPELAMAF